MMNYKLCFAKIKEIPLGFFPNNDVIEGFYNEY